MWSRFTIKTAYASLSNKEIYQMAQHADNSQARIEFVTRFFTCSWITRYGTKDEVKNICKEELNKYPQHNLFNYAMAQLEEDYAKKINFLMMSANCAAPWVTISAQAAYELSQMHYPTYTGNITPCLAWLSQAIILGSQQACDSFLNNNLCGKDKKFNLIMIAVVFLTTHFAGKKISGLAESTLLNDYIKNASSRGVPRDVSSFIQAYAYPNHLPALHQPDSPLRKIAEWIISSAPKGFIDYFSYCYEHAILNEETYINLILFYLNSGYTDKFGLRQNAIDALKKHNLQDRIAEPVIPQENQPVCYATGYPSAPPIDNSVNSYYYFYTAEPQMAPNMILPITQQPEAPSLEPIYTPITNKPTVTATKSTVQQQAKQAENDEISYFTGMGLYYGRIRIMY